MHLTNQPKERNHLPYRYTQHLLALEAQQPSIPRPLPTLGASITTPLIIDNWRAGRIIGPIDPRSMPEAQVSRFGVIPKANQPGKWRLILDLSSPNNHSVNDGIPKELCSMQYASIDDAVDMIMQAGQGCLLAKIDIEHVYRNIPVHNDDRPLLAMRWNDNLYIDTVLPFGLWSAPKIFSAVADALEWILQHQGVTFILHYLDDFLTMGKTGTSECQKKT